MSECPKVHFVALRFIYLKKLECVTKKKTTNDVTHNANFERVILIYVTDITL